MAAVFCASLSRRAMVWRSRVIRTRSSRAPSSARTVRDDGPRRVRWFWGCGRVRRRCLSGCVGIRRRAGAAAGHARGAPAGAGAVCADRRCSRRRGGGRQHRSLGTVTRRRPAAGARPWSAARRRGPPTRSARRLRGRDRRRGCGRAAVRQRSGRRGRRQHVFLQHLPVLARALDLAIGQAVLGHQFLRRGRWRHCRCRCRSGAAARLAIGSTPASARRPAPRRILRRGSWRGRRGRCGGSRRRYHSRSRRGCRCCCYGRGRCCYRSRRRLGAGAGCRCRWRRSVPRH